MIVTLIIVIAVVFSLTKNFMISNNSNKKYCKINSKQTSNQASEQTNEQRNKPTQKQMNKL